MNAFALLFKKSTQQGSIFVEVLITIAVLGVITITLMSAILYGLYLSRRADRLTRATELSNQSLEIIRATPFDQLPLQVDGPLLGNPPPDYSILPEGNAQLTIAEHATYATLKEIILTVSYREGAGTKTLTFTTLAGEGGAGA